MRAKKLCFAFCRRNDYKKCNVRVRGRADVFLTSIDQLAFSRIILSHNYLLIRRIVSIMSQDYPRI
jgi:hypothetical protein